MAHSSPYLDDVEDSQDEDLKLISRRKSPKDGAQPQSPLETYLREINETPLLSADDEHELAIAIGALYFFFMLRSRVNQAAIDVGVIAGEVLDYFRPQQPH